MEILNTFKERFNLPTKDFSTIEVQELPVNLVRMGDGSVQFEVELPKYFYDKLISGVEIQNGKLGNKFNQPEYYSKENVKRVIRFGFLIGCQDTISKYASDATFCDTIEGNYGEKFIFIKYTASNSQRRENTHGADMGVDTNINFTFFVAYKKEGEFPTFFDGSVYKIKLFGYAIKNNYNKIDNGNLVPFGEYESDVKSILSNYTVVPYTEEREAYLKKLQWQFQNLASNLDEYLKNLNTDKLDNLVLGYKKNLLIDASHGTYYSDMEGWEELDGFDIYQEGDQQFEGNKWVDVKSKYFGELVGRGYVTRRKIITLDTEQLCTYLCAVAKAMGVEAYKFGYDCNPDKYNNLSEIINKYPNESYTPLLESWINGWNKAQMEQQIKIKC